jgi:hypothetical protein
MESVREEAVRLASVLPERAQLQCARSMGAVEANRTALLTLMR